MTPARDRGAARGGQAARDVRCARTTTSVMKAQTLAEPGHVADALAFASRAWRRPLTPPRRRACGRSTSESRAVNKLDHDAAIRALLARILVSPAFLYRVETAPPGRRDARSTAGSWPAG